MDVYKFVANCFIFESRDCWKWMDGQRGPTAVQSVTPIRLSLSLSLSTFGRLQLEIRTKNTPNGSFKRPTKTQRHRKRLEKFKITTIKTSYRAGVNGAREREEERREGHKDDSHYQVTTARGEEKKKKTPLRFQIKEEKRKMKNLNQMYR